jgi:hypothetical protein
MQEPTTIERDERTFSAVAEGAWAKQADHERFLPFKAARAKGHPSRAAWDNANRIWQATKRPENLGLLAG